jgi:serine/threonine protein phosphatase PrpC
VIGCDGVFEKLSNTDVCNKIWEASLQPEDLRLPSTVHQRCGSAIDMLLHECVNEKTLDNITSVIIGFQNYETQVEKARSSQNNGPLLGFTKNKLEAIEEVELQWDEEISAVEDSESHRLMQKLLKPLEPVEEEVECSEITTPASEAVDMTPNKRKSKLIKKPQDEEER